MFTVIAMSAVSVAACLVTLSRVIGWKRILDHATVIDVCFTLLLGLFLAGTLTGALVALLGGLFMAVTLTALKHILKFTEAVTKPKTFDPLAAFRTSDGGLKEYNAAGDWLYNQAPYV